MALRVSIITVADQFVLITAGNTPAEAVTQAIACAPFDLSGESFLIEVNYAPNKSDYTAM